MKKRGNLIIYSGPSGVGKGTVRKELFEMEDLHLKYSISMTTRKPREGELEGIDYFFVSRETFENAIANDELLEYAEFVGNYYGTPRAYVESLLEQGFNVMLEIEVEGAKKVMAKCPDAISIFLMPPSFDALERRIRGRRTEEEEIVQMRLSKARQEMNLQDKYQYVVVNDSVDKAKEEIAKIIKKYA
ncbi:MAG: guanylate kinase [Bacilli bacterium]|nr:guanylate kinase [Bacilli bacterium]